MECNVVGPEGSLAQVHVTSARSNPIKRYLKRLGSSRMLSPLVVLVIWQIIGQMKLVDPIFLPTPSAILRQFFLMIRTGELFVHVGASMGRMLAGFSLACVVGILLGVTMAWFRIMDRILEPLIDLVGPSPRWPYFPWPFYGSA
jgi:ABC-type nitrate/sulfonate/bicarbonate transport system permease component